MNDLKARFTSPLFAVGLLASLLVILPLTRSIVVACPFCSATAQTFSEEMATMDVVAIAKLVNLPPVTDNNDEVAKAKFEIVELIKGSKNSPLGSAKADPVSDPANPEAVAKEKNLSTDSGVKIGDIIETIYFGDGKPGATFLIMGIDPPKVMWSTPLLLSPRAKEYLGKITKLPKDGNERYMFFQNYLEDSDEMLARDAYDEFAKAPYSTIKDLKPHMNHDQLVSWIQNADIPASRRRLYLVMLGVCGNEKDLPMLATAMKSSDRKAKSGLDALIACYLTLKGETGMELVEDLYLKNKKSDYADTYSAIMALRFHGTEGGVIKKERLLTGFKYMLDRPELADLVIPDLANWEDWSAMDQLFDLFKNADEKSTWVRVPVINYLRKCPLAKAKDLLKECEKIDPASVKRANTFFPGDPAPAAPDPKKATSIPDRAADASETATASFEVPVPPADEQEVAKAEQGEETASVVNKGAPPAAAIRQNPVDPPNRWLLLGVPWGIGVALFFVQWCVLRGLG
ncbi:hypothetical protein NA78x_000084 [Anatilimnocola sp. NA78]|uniref:hypothetical protein n=1 Tax=Anatilimnocola sp. NA78 TaxID=3415683 RepID=UPI003CE45404